MMVKKKGATTKRLPAKITLAKPGDPLVTADGQTIAPDRYRAPEPEEVRALITPSDFKPQRKRTSKELPAPSGMMNGIGVVFMYTMLGLTDREISDLLSITPVEIEQLRASQAYSEFFDCVHNEFVNADSAFIQSRIAAYAHGALTRVRDLSMSEDEPIALRASIDLLDRAGHSPKERERSSATSQNALRIVVIEGGNKEVHINLNGQGE